jgi:hypothetical protein
VVPPPAWDYRLKSGQTLWDGLVTHYSRGVATVDGMQKTWAGWPLCRRRAPRRGRRLPGDPARRSPVVARRLGGVVRQLLEAPAAGGGEGSGPFAGVLRRAELPVRARERMTDEGFLGVASATPHPTRCAGHLLPQGEKDDLILITPPCGSTPLLRHTCQASRVSPTGEAHDAEDQDRRRRRAGDADRRARSFSEGWGRAAERAGDQEGRRRPAGPRLPAAGRPVQRHPHPSRARLPGGPDRRQAGQGDAGARLHGHRGRGQDRRGGDAEERRRAQDPGPHRAGRPADGGKDRAALCQPGPDHLERRHGVHRPFVRSRHPHGRLGRHGPRPGRPEGPVEGHAGLRRPAFGRDRQRRQGHAGRRLHREVRQARLRFRAARRPRRGGRGLLQGRGPDLDLRRAWT